MRGKIAKKARAIARARTEGNPERVYHKKPNGVIMVVPTTQRGMYKMIKKMLKGKVS